MNRYMLEHFPVPSTLRLPKNDGTEQEVLRQRDVFFQSVRDELGLGTTDSEALFTSESRGLCKPFRQNADTQVSHDNIHLLDFAGIQTVASVLDRRDDQDFRIVTFSAHLLSVQAMDRVLNLRRELRGGN